MVGMPIIVTTNTTERIMMMAIVTTIMTAAGPTRVAVGNAVTALRVTALPPIRSMVRRSAPAA